ncbi:hypothetical protein CLOSTHATH_00447 [Hungatella hathewayi DSM 13479]|uniref:Uncharacterized protein n=1 Tax=Hungatella hathewayi DSM 13479 TaxID=566550 RepID=D3AA26_9FIRM|nr:hypothetical protein CLOSTHATH_00447 [Hungatella hathewayi DSM 13479]
MDTLILRSWPAASRRRGPVRLITDYRSLLWIVKKLLIFNNSYCY